MTILDQHITEDQVAEVLESVYEIEIARDYYKRLYIRIYHMHCTVYIANFGNTDVPYDTLEEAIKEYNNV